MNPLFFFKRDITQIKLPILGNVKPELTKKTDFKYEVIIEEFVLRKNNFQIDIYFQNLDNRTIEKVSKTLSSLEKIHDLVQNAYLLENNNENSQEYIDGIYKKFLTEIEYNQLIQNSSTEERLSCAFSIGNIIIFAKGDTINITVYSIFGYEFKLIFELNENYIIKQQTLEPGSFLCKKQFFDFTNKWEKSDGWEKCARFKTDWWNEPVISYYIFHMGERIEGYLLDQQNQK